MKRSMVVRVSARRYAIVWRSDTDPQVWWSAHRTNGFVYGRFDDLLRLDLRTWSTKREASAVCDAENQRLSL